MSVFKIVSSENTVPALEIAFRKAQELSTDIVLPATGGVSAMQAIEIAMEIGFSRKLVIVTHVWGMKTPGENSLPSETRVKLEEAGAIIVTAGHAFGGVERAVSGKFGGTYPAEIMANTLRMLCAGVKVCVEIGAMALDAGCIEYQKPIVAMGGTERGLDTACVLTPGYSARIFDTRVHEILCKPY